jgi:hypothetical protein
LGVHSVLLFVRKVKSARSSPSGRRTLIGLRTSTPCLRQGELREKAQRCTNRLVLNGWCVLRMLDRRVTDFCQVWIPNIGCL